MEPIKRYRVNMSRGNSTEEENQEHKAASQGFQIAEVAAKLQLKGSRNRLSMEFIKWGMTERCQQLHKSEADEIKLTQICKQSNYSRLTLQQRQTLRLNFVEAPSMKHRTNTNTYQHQEAIDRHVTRFKIKEACDVLSSS